MLYAFLIALAVAIVLGIAYYFELKSSKKQATEQEQLLKDYQQRVDEQQKLLDDYRALEKNFDTAEEQAGQRGSGEALQCSAGAVHPSGAACPEV